MRGAREMRDSAILAADARSVIPGVGEFFDSSKKVRRVYPDDFREFRPQSGKTHKLWAQAADARNLALGTLHRKVVPRKPL